MNVSDHDVKQLLLENAELRIRLEEAESTLVAIRSGDVDALIVGEDVYTLDRAAAADNRLRNDVLAQMEDAVIAFDLEDRVIFMNPAAELQYGCNMSATLGRSRFELYRESWPDAEAQELCQLALRQTGSYRAHSIHYRNDGRTLHAESMVSQMRDINGAIVGYLSVIRDISERVLAEEALQVATVALARRERQFSTLVENSPDIFARIGRDHCYLYVSPVAAQYTGIDPDNYIGKTNAALGMPESYCAIWDQALAEVFAYNKVVRIKVELPTLQQDVRVFDARLIPERGDEDGVESVLCILSDVTEQERGISALRASEARLQFTLDAAQIGDWALDLDTLEASHSLRHDRCFGYTEPVPNWNMQIFLEHVHPEDRVDVEAHYHRSVARREKWSFECRVIWPDKSIHWIEAHGSILNDNTQPRRMLGIVVDATTRKLAEEALRDADRRKDEFLATLAHELRNPLAPISNALQLMRLTHDAQMLEKSRSIIERQLLHLVHLVNDLLDVSRISQGKVELRRKYVDVADVVQTAIETNRHLLDSGRHEFSVQLPSAGELMVDADVTRLTQIIANLLSNAAKYTMDGGSIAVVVAADGADALISVQDTGIGIPQDMLPRVFDMFAQIDPSMERAQGGLGIGLALVRRLVEMHGGSVHAYSDGPGLGSRFTVRIPVAPVPAPALEKEAEPVYPEPATTLQEFRVLVVDDNVDSAESLAQMMKLLGYQTQVANEGNEAVRIAAAWHPHLVLLDIGLPGLNGHEVAQILRRQKWGEDLLLIALSGWGQEEDKRNSKRAGFDHHFVKPVDIRALISLIGNPPHS